MFLWFKVNRFFRKIKVSTLGFVLNGTCEHSTSCTSCIRLVPLNISTCSTLYWKLKLHDNKFYDISINFLRFSKNNYPVKPLYV